MFDVRLIQDAIAAELLGFLGSLYLTPDHSISSR